MSSDFASSYFLPNGKYEYLQIIELGDDDCRVLYKGREDFDDEVQMMSLEQIHQMLGLEEIGSNPYEEDEVEEAVKELSDQISDEANEELVGTFNQARIYRVKGSSRSKESIYFGAINAPSGSIIDGYEHTGGYRIKLDPKVGTILEVHCEE